MSRVIEFLRLLDKDDPAFGALKLFAVLCLFMFLAIILSMVVAAWKFTLGVCS